MSTIIDLERKAWTINQNRDKKLVEDLIDFEVGRSVSFWKLNIS